MLGSLPILSSIHPKSVSCPQPLHRNPSNGILKGQLVTKVHGCPSVSLVLAKAVVLQHGLLTSSSNESLLEMQMLRPYNSDLLD